MHGGWFKCIGHRGHDTGSNTGQRGTRGATLLGGWKSTIDDVVVQPSMPNADTDREGIQREKSLSKDNKKIDFQQKEKVSREHASRYNKAQNPVKTNPLRAVIKLDNIHLTEHIESLRDLSLVGK